MISSMGGYRCCHIQFWNMVIMEKEKRYVASISGGKDSMAMVLGLMEKGWPLTHCVYFDTGMEFSWGDRDKYIQIACPYGFRFDYLLNVYERAKKKGLIEKVEPHTTSLMYALGDRLYQAYGDQTNIKITTKEDLALFEGYVLLQQRKMKL